MKLKYENLKFASSILEKSKVGSYGSYIRLDKKTGIKLIGEGYSQFEYLLDSDCWHQCNDEVDFYNMLKKSKFTPNKVKMTIVLVGNIFYPGIIMQHLVGKTLDEYCNNNYDGNEFVFIDGKVKKAQHYVNLESYDIRSEISNYFNKTLILKYKIYNEDITNPRNIIITKSGKVNIVDFTPDCMYKINKSKVSQKMIEKAKKWKPFFRNNEK